jgi:hypothetical protein
MIGKKNSNCVEVDMPFRKLMQGGESCLKMLLNEWNYCFELKDHMMFTLSGTTGSSTVGL